MAVTVTMPQLGESVTEGTIQQWLKQPGDSVERYESIAEVNTDKVNAEIPSPVAGTMGEHLVAEGTVVPVGQPICRIEGAAEEPAAREEAAISSSAAASASEPAAAVARPAAVPGNGMHLTPAVRMLAREHSVDVAQITGSGIGGRVTKKDVLEFVQRRDAGEGRRPAPAPAAAPPPPTPAAAPPVAAAPAPGTAPASSRPPACTSRSCHSWPEPASPPYASSPP